MGNRYLVVGCGLSGAVMARCLAEEKDEKVLIIEKREHIGGNCYDFVDENGIRMNNYGAHLFHTNEERVWDYVNRFSKWARWEHKVLGLVEDQYVPLPPNITTVNMLCGQHICDQYEAEKWLSQVQVKHASIENGYQMATSRVGIDLYEKIFKNYTYKQWGRYPDELNADVLARIPMRNNFDDRYFTDKYQALPLDGYTKMFKNILDHENIKVKLCCDFFNLASTDLSDSTIIYTGPIDDYFSNHGYEKLEYRSIQFHIQRIQNLRYYQPCSVVNYPGLDKPFTRIVEYKHFLNQESPHTTIVAEISCSKGDPYYPVPNKKNTTLYEQYKRLADKYTDIHLVGRLANYKYFNMDQAILNALEYYDSHFNE